MNICTLSLITLSLLSLLNVSYAALNGNDTTQNYTWQQDANQVKTSCNGNAKTGSAFWQAFDPATIGSQSTGRTKAQTCIDESSTYRTYRE